MALSYHYDSAEAAEQELAADGWTYRAGLTAELGPYWAKPCKVDDAAGGYATMALVQVRRQTVDPQHGADYFDLRFF